MAQPERLADAHAGLRQKCEEEAVPQVITGVEEHGDLLDGERLRQAPAHPQANRPPWRPPSPPADLVQERLVGAPSTRAPTDELLGDFDTVPGVEVIEPEHRREVTVDRRLGTSGEACVDHDHTLGRGPQRRDEAANVIELDGVKGDLSGLEVLEEQLEARCVGAHRVR